MRLDHRTDTRDPLAAYMAGAFLSADRRPIPLLDTRFAVQIDAGLADVETTRVFRNAEDKSIEATITFPGPVHAILFGLSARIGDRHLVARARRREAAREDYEAAVESGHTAVLHEEVLKDVHTLSITHVPPGAEIAVETRWAMPLSVVAGKGILRIPLTAGDIYGRSPLSEADDLVAGGPQLTGRLSVKVEGQKVWLHGRPVDGSEITVPLNRPIDLSVPVRFNMDRPPKHRRCLSQRDFRPCAHLSSFDDENEAIERANSLDYGLAATLWTRDMDRARRVARQVEAGTVWINCWRVRDERVAFGGMKRSGLGREGGDWSLDFYSELKTICLVEPDA